MSRRPNAASTKSWSDFGDGSRIAAILRYAAYVISFVVVLMFVATSAGHAASSFYWYGENNSTCWQTGQLGSSHTECDSVAAGHLATPGGHTGGLEYMSEGGNSTNLTQLSSSGDYCSYARLGGQLKYQDSTNEGMLSGLTMPIPYSSYQEGDKTTNAYNACQADGTYWGQAVRGPSGNGCAGEACGIGHYVSLRSQGTSDRPWSSAFGEPSLVLSVEAGVTNFTATGSSYGGWGYVCPELEDTDPSFHGVIEYCLQEWRSAHDAPQWKNERVQECASPSSQINTYFWPGTSYATEMSGSHNTFEVGSAGSGHFEAKITQANLVKAAQLINASCAGWHLSENPASYALVGVENGLEGYYGVTAMGGWGANLQLRTEYTPLSPPTVSAGGAANVTSTSATLEGSVNPNGSETHYYFEYGETPGYGNRTAEGSAGSGTTAVPVSAALSGLNREKLYYYRLVASNAAGTSYPVTGGTFTPEGPEAGSPSVVTSTGELAVFSRNSLGEVIQFGRSPSGEWTSTNLTALAGGEGYMEVKHPYITGMPEPIVTPGGHLAVYARRTNGELVGFSQATGGGWSAWNITGMAGGEGYMEVKHPSIATTPSPVIDNTNEFSVFAQRSNHEVVQFVRSSGGGWSALNITGMVSSHPNIASRAMAIAPNKGEPLMFAQTASGEVLNIFRSAGGSWSDWTMNPLYLETRTFNTTK
jgi:hypothetical protein